MVRSLGDRPALDGIRAIAIVAVMGLHAIDRLFSGGFFGVDIFFVLSAFLITSIILDELRTSAGAYRFRDFYWRRALRLGPALILWLGLLAWPTAVEEQFYLLWPLVLVLLWRRRRRVRVLRWSVVGMTLAVVLTAATSSLLPNSYFQPNSYFLLTGHLIPLAAGVAAALLYAEGGSPALERVLRLRSTAVLSVAVLAVLICGYGWLRPVGGVLLQTVVALASAALILHVCLDEGSPVSRLLGWAPVVWLGRRSYGLYLYHRTLTILLPALFPGLTLRYMGPLVLLVSFLIAEASYRFVERPVLRMGRARLERRRELAMSQPSSRAPGSV